MIKHRNIPRPTREAADWLTRLSDPKIETDELEAFCTWRAQPENRAAYERLEDLSRTLADLDHDPEITAAARRAMAPVRRRSGMMPSRAMRAVILIGGAVAAVLLAGVAGVLAWRQPTYSTEVGQTFTARLEDGSRVILNTDSQLRVRYGAHERRVELMRGQALFEVAHNPARPFIVQAGDTETRALGTRFEVRRLGDSVRVVLTQGSVIITDKDAPKAVWRLAPGQALAVPHNASASITPIAIDAKTATSWTTGNLVFRDMPLAEAINELNRYNKHKIALAAGVPSHRVISGVFPAGDNTDFIAAAASIFGLTSVRQPNGDISLQPKVRHPT